MVNLNRTFCFQCNALNENYIKVHPANTNHTVALKFIVRERT